MRKKVVLGMSAFLLSFLMVGCQKDRVEGVYKYVETKGDDSYGIRRYSSNALKALWE